ncbi:hypothetical protein VW098_15740 [Phaeobacter sp. JH57H2]
MISITAICRRSKAADICHIDQAFGKMRPAATDKNGDIEVVWAGRCTTQVISLMLMPLDAASANRSEGRAIRSEPADLIGMSAV